MATAKIVGQVHKVLKNPDDYLQEGSSIVNPYLNESDMFRDDIIEGSLFSFNQNDEAKNFFAVLKKLFKQEKEVVVSVSSADGEDGQPLVDSSKTEILFNEDGTFSIYNPDFERLAQDELAEISFLYRVDNGNGKSTVVVREVTMEITGTNEAPVIVEEADRTAIEDGVIIEGQVLANDIDSDNDGDSPEEALTYLLVDTTLPSGFIFNTDGSYSFDPSMAEYQYLSEGQEADYTFSWQAEDNHGALSEVDSVTITITGTNDQPYAYVTSASTLEDVNINASSDQVNDTLNLLYGVQDLDVNDTHYISAVNGVASNVGTTVTLVSGAKLSVNQDGSYSYIPVDDYSGDDSFTYTLSDGIATDTKTVTVHVEAVADVPTLSVSIEEGNNVNEALLVIDAALTDTDGSESLQLVVSGIADGTTLTNATKQGNDWIINNPDLDVLMHWNKEQNQSMDIIITATATESSNGGSAETIFTTPLKYSVSMTSEDYAFEALNQNIWGGGDAYLLEDHRFIGITDNSGDVQYTFGLQSDFEASGGFVDAVLDYEITFNTYHNYFTDTLLIDADYSSLGGAFNTESPKGSYNLDFLVGLDVTMGLPFDLADYSFGTGGTKTFDLLYFDETYSSDPIDLYGVATVQVSWPYIETDTESSASTMTSSGEDWFLALNLDIDDLVSTIYPAIQFSTSFYDDFTYTDSVLGTKWGFDGGFTAEALDLDLLSTFSMVQDFTLGNEGISGDLYFENGSHIDLDFDNDLLLSNVSSYDYDGDGLLEFDTDIFADAQFTNETGIGIDLELSYVIGRLIVYGSVYYGAGAESADVTLTAYEDSYAFGLGEINLYNDTFDLTFTEAEMPFIA